MFTTTPSWHINGVHMENVDSLEILGVLFSTSLSAVKHIEKRASSCRRAYYGLSDIGMCYPGLPSDVKSYLWKSVCAPCLLYGCDTLYIGNIEMQSLETVQGTLVKQCLGLTKRSRHSYLLKAMGLCQVEHLLQKRFISLYKQIFSVESPAKQLASFLLSRYMLTGETVPGTLLNKIVNNSLSPLDIGIPLSRSHCGTVKEGSNGIIDSMRQLIMHEHFIKPWSQEHILLKLLTKAF